MPIISHSYLSLPIEGISIYTFFAKFTTCAHVSIWPVSSIKNPDPCPLDGSSVKYGSFQFILISSAIILTTQLFIFFKFIINFHIN